jgi:hypothetical protein
MKKLIFLVLAFFFVTPSISLRAGSEPLIVMVSLSNHAEAATASGGTIDLPETGQTTCYDEAGTAIACAGTGQDGEIGAGVTWPWPQFTDNGGGAIQGTDLNITASNAVVSTIAGIAGVSGSADGTGTAATRK